jgi:hypothetical protein
MFDSSSESNVRADSGLENGTEQCSKHCPAPKPNTWGEHMSDLLALSQNSLRNAEAVQSRFAAVPGTKVRLLTKTSKMPGPSWSLPAHKACRGRMAASVRTAMPRKAAIGGALQSRRSMPGLYGLSSLYGPRTGASNG